MTDWISLSTIITLFGAVISAAGAFWLAYKESQATYSKRILLIIFIGALLSTAGATWSSIEQSQYEKEIRQRSEEILATLTGGDGYAYVKDPFITFNSHIEFFLVNKGRYPLHEVIVEIADIAKMREVFKMPLSLRSGPNFDKFERLYRTRINIGTMLPSPNPDKSLTGVQLGGWELPTNQDYQSYSIWISALNGGVTQRIILKRTNSMWRIIGDKAIRWDNKEERYITLHEKFSEDYPRNEKGEIDWNLY